MNLYNTFGPHVPDICRVVAWRRGIVWKGADTWEGL